MKADKKNKNEFDVTKEDKKNLGNANVHNDNGDDDLLRKRKRPANFAGSELDIPGAELDDARARTGNEDEENNVYSLGGDRHEDLEEEEEGR